MFGLSIDLRQAILGVIEDELRLKLAATWVLGLMPQLTEGMDKDALKVWLKDFWIASHVNMADLKRQVEARDKQIAAIPDDSDEYLDHYLYEKSKKREGWFMRRWANVAAAKGSVKAGSDYLLVLRFWMWRLAGALAMPEAVAWGREVRSGMVGASTLTERVWYMAEIDAVLSPSSGAPSKFIGTGKTR